LLVEVAKLNKQKRNVMNKFVYVLVGLLAFSPALVRAEDKPAAVKPAADKTAERPSREEIREQLKNLTPEEREAKIKELREKHGDGAAGRDPEKFREEMKERAKELGLNYEELQKLPPEERRMKMREGFQKKHEELKKKQTDGTITETEKKHLAQMDAMKKRFEEQGRDGSRREGPDGKGNERDARKRPQIEGRKLEEKKTEEKK
jgi:hypothetical protein